MELCVRVLDIAFHLVDQMGRSSQHCLC